MFYTVNNVALHLPNAPLETFYILTPEPHKKMAQEINSDAAYALLHRQNFRRSNTDVYECFNEDGTYVMKHYNTRVAKLLPDNRLAVRNLNVSVTTTARLRALVAVQKERGDVFVGTTYRADFPCRNPDTWMIPEDAEVLFDKVEALQRPNVSWHHAFWPTALDYMDKNCPRKKGQTPWHRILVENNNNYRRSSSHDDLYMYVNTLCLVQARILWDYQVNVARRVLWFDPVTNPNKRINALSANFWQDTKGQASPNITKKDLVAYRRKEARLKQKRRPQCPVKAT